MAHSAQNNDPQVPMTTAHYVVAGKDAAREANRQWWLGDADKAEVAAQVAMANLAVAQTWMLKRIADALDDIAGGYYPADDPEDGAA